MELQRCRTHTWPQPRRPELLFLWFSAGQHYRGTPFLILLLLLAESRSDAMDPSQFHVHSITLNFHTCDKWLNVLFHISHTPSVTPSSSPRLASWKFVKYKCRLCKTGRMWFCVANPKQEPETSKQDLSTTEGKQDAVSISWCFVFGVPVGTQQ